jgi:hypothetical protein
MSCIKEKPPVEESEGLPHLEWNRVLDNYLVNSWVSSEDYEALGRDQRMVIQELKKAFKRLK